MASWITGCNTETARQGSTLRKNFISPAGLVTVNFASPDINDKYFQMKTSVDSIVFVDNIKRIQCIVVN